MAIRGEIDVGIRLIVRKGKKQYRASLLTLDAHGESLEEALDALEEELRKAQPKTK